MKKISIGEYMRNARLAKNVTVEEVSKALEMPMQYITVMEHNQFKFLDEGKIKEYLASYGEYLGLDSQLLIEGYEAPSFEIEVEETEEEKRERKNAEQSVPKKKWLRTMRFDYVKDPKRKLPLIILSLLTVLIIGVIGTAIYFELDQEARFSSVPSSSLEKSSQADASSSSQAILTTSVKNSNMAVTVNSGGETVTIEVSQDSDEDNLVRVTNSDLAKKGQLLSEDTKSVTATIKRHVDKVVIMLGRVDKTSVKINGQQLDLSSMNKDAAGYITLTLK